MPGLVGLLAQVSGGAGPTGTLPGIPVTPSTTIVPGTDPSSINSIQTPTVDWGAILPIVVLFAGAVLLITVCSLVRRRPKGFYAGWTVITALVAMATAVPIWARVQGFDDIAGHNTFLFWHYNPPYKGPYSVIAASIGVDGFTVFATVIICIALILGAFAADSYLRREGLDGPEFYVLMMLSAAGGVIMASANDLIVVFIGLETLSIAVYVLAAMHLKRVQSQEAGMKYFVLGAFSSAFFLYGIAMIYGATGTTNLVGIKNALSGTIQLNNSLLVLGFGLLLVGFGFKVAAVPFHSWSPDVYDGSPTPAVVFMSSAVKVAAFAGLARVFMVAFSQYATDWQPIVYALAVLSLVFGAVVGVVQTNVKRMLAYSSINHAGFLLMAIESSSGNGTTALLFYLAVYVFMVAGAFGVAALVGRTGDGRHTLDDYRGLGRTNPFLAGSFTVLLLAQAGVPFTTGFLAKFYAVIAAVDAGSTYLAIVAMLASVVASFIYLRIIVAMYMSEGEAGGADTRPTAADRIRVPATAGLGIAICVIVTIAFGLFPNSLTDLASRAQPVLVETIPDQTASTPPPAAGTTPGAVTSPGGVDSGGGAPGAPTGGGAAGAGAAGAGAAGAGAAGGGAVSAGDATGGVSSGP
jgi:NADH-quinone oxidoreductase subunit N